MLAGQFVQAPLQAHANLKILRTDGQDPPVFHDRAEHPVVQRDLGNRP